jgi:DNA-binding NarL/FixJ family response regulator
VANDALVPARKAAREGDWGIAYERFSSVDTEGLAGEDLEMMADAAWWTLHNEESLAIRQKSYTAFIEAGDKARAGHAAWFMSIDYELLGEPSLASGWYARAERCLAEVAEGVEHGFFATTEAFHAMEAGDMARARRETERAIELGRRLGERDLEAMGIQILGRVLIRSGEVDEGLRLLDEAMTAVHAGEVSRMYVGWIYCHVLGTCMEIVDLRRASEWTRAALTWTANLSHPTPLHGFCRLYRLEVAILLGEWAEAAAQAERASGELMPVGPMLAGEATYELGEVQRLRGDLSAAEETFARAHGLGCDPQPGLALILLAQNRNDSALAALRLSLVEEGIPLYKRVRLLGAFVEVAVAAGDLGAAASAADELDSIAASTPTSVLVATADAVRGALLLAQGESADAVQRLRRALETWQDLKVPYQAARTRLLIGIACRREGDEEGGRLEIQAALDSFARLGAELDRRDAEQRLGEQPGAPAGLSAREIEVLKLVAAGKTNRAIAAELILSEHTISRHLQNIFRKLGVSSRAAATAFAFENSLV